MKKLSLLLFIPLFVFSALLAKSTDEGTKANLAKQELAAPAAKVVDQQAAAIEQARSFLAWKSAFRGISRGEQLTSREKAIEQKALSPQEAARERRLRHRPRHQEAMGSYPFLNKQRARPEREATLLKTLNGGYIPVQILDVTGEPITELTVGDTIVMIITYGDSVWLEPYVDNGDGTFDPATDLYFYPGDGEDGDEEIVFIDGDEDDEDPTVGVWQITFDTGAGDEESGLFMVQGTSLFLSLSNNDGSDTGLAALDVLPPVSTTMLSGEVDVLDPPGPAANAIVIAFPMSGMMEEGPGTMFITLTDAEGHYELVIPDDETGQQFMVMAMDFFGIYGAVFPVPMFHDPFVGVGANIPGLNFTLEAATATIFGALRDETGAGIGGIRIFANMDGPFGMVDTTGADGSFTLDVIPGSWELRPSRDDLIDAGYMASWREVELEVFEGPNGPVDIMAFTADGTIQGHVAWESGENAVGIEIGTHRFDFESWTETDADGNYTLRVSSVLDTMTMNPEDPYSHQEPGYWVNVWTDEALSSPPGHGPTFAGAVDVDFILYDVDAWLVGTIYDEDSGEPLCDAEISAHTINDTLWLGSWSRSECDEGGAYELPLVSGHEWVVQVFRPYEGWPPVIIDSLGFVYPGEIPRDFYLPARAEFVAIEGHVYTMEGHLIANARVEIIQTDGGYYREIYTDEGGFFRVDDAPAFGEFDVTASVKDQWQHQHVWTNGMDVYIAFWMGEIRYRIDGVVLDDMDEPILGAFVLAYEPDNDQPVDGFFTGEDGYYEMFLKGGMHTIKAGATGFLMDAWTIDVVEDTTHDFMLAPAGDALTASITGQVISPGEWGLGWVFVVFVSDAYIALTYTDFDGYYSLDLVPGEYMSFYQKEGFQEHAQNWTVPDGVSDGYNVTLYPEAFLELDRVFDVPDDHGKQMMLEWSINPLFGRKFTRFEVWEIGIGTMDHDPYYPDHGPPPRHVGTVPIHPDFEEYRFVARTLRDDVETWYMVTAHGEGVWDYWDSNWMSGMSHDDLAPMIPAGVVATAGATGLDVNLAWAPSVDDPVAATPVKYYTIYRATSMTETPTQVGYADKPEFTEALASDGMYWYAVSATDFGGNESAKSEPIPYNTLGVADGLGVPEVYALGANYPNPFNPSTVITYQLPEAGHVSLLVYDLTGKLIRTLVSEVRPAGYYKIMWDGRDAKGSPTATGVYFYRLVAGDAFTETRKMVLMK